MKSTWNSEISNREPQDEEEKDEDDLEMKKTQRHEMLKVLTRRGKHLGWNPKKSM